MTTICNRVNGFNIRTLSKLVLLEKAITSEKGVYKSLYRVNDFNVMILSKLVLLVKTITSEKDL